MYASDLFASSRFSLPMFEAAPECNRPGICCRGREASRTKSQLLVPADSGIPQARMCTKPHCAGVTARKPREHANYHGGIRIRNDAWPEVQSETHRASPHLPASLVAIEKEWGPASFRDPASVR